MIHLKAQTRMASHYFREAKKAAEAGNLDYAGDLFALSDSVAACTPKEWLEIMSGTKICVEAEEEIKGRSK